MTLSSLERHYAGKINKTFTLTLVEVMKTTLLSCMLIVHVSRGEKWANKVVVLVIAVVIIIVVVLLLLAVVGR